MTVGPPAQPWAGLTLREVQALPIDQQRAIGAGDRAAYQLAVAVATVLDVFGRAKVEEIELPSFEPTRGGRKVHAARPSTPRSKHTFREPETADPGDTDRGGPR